MAVSEGAARHIARNSFIALSFRTCPVRKSVPGLKYRFMGCRVKRYFHCSGARNEARCADRLNPVSCGAEGSRDRGRVATGKNNVDNRRDDLPIGKKEAPATGKNNVDTPRKVPTNVGSVIPEPSVKPGTDPTLHPGRHPENFSILEFTFVNISRSKVYICKLSRGIALPVNWPLFVYRLQKEDRDPLIFPCLRDKYPGTISTVFCLLNDVVIAFYRALYRLFLHVTTYGNKIYILSGILLFVTTRCYRVGEEP